MSLARLTLLVTPPFLVLGWLLSETFIPPLLDLLAKAWGK